MPIKVSNFAFANQKYVKSTDFSQASNDYFDYKIENNLYVRQCFSLEEKAKLDDKAIAFLDKHPDLKKKLEKYSGDELVKYENYIRNYVASLEDREEIANYSLTRVSEEYADIMKNALDDVTLVAGFTLAMLFPESLAASVIGAALLETPGIYISSQQGNKLETVLRVVWVGLSLAGGISSLVSKGSTYYNTIASTYGKDTAKAISEWLADFVPSKYISENESTKL